MEHHIPAITCDEGIRSHFDDNFSQIPLWVLAFRLCYDRYQTIIKKYCEADKLEDRLNYAEFMYDVLYLNKKKEKKISIFNKLHVGGITLDEVETYRYLGTEIDNKLSGEFQYNKIMQTI